MNLALVMVLLAAAPVKPKPKSPARPAPQPAAAPAAPSSVPPEPVAAPAAAPSPQPAPTAPSDLDPARPRIGVYDFRGVGVESALAPSLTAVVAEALERVGLFKVFTTQVLASILALERQKQLLGCSESESTNCMAEIAEALGVEYIVAGTVTRLGSEGSRLHFELSLLDVKATRRISSVVLESGDATELAAQARRSMSRLLEPLLKNRIGYLNLRSSEKGALVKIDDQPVGTTPLGSRLELTAIPHAVSLEKEGFVTWSKVVTMATGQTEELSATLTPSADFAAAYESKHRKLRVGAWVSTALAVAGAGLFAYARLQVNRLYGDPSPDVNRALVECTTFSCHRQRLVDGLDVEGTVDHRLQAQAVGAQISSNITLGYVALGAGAAAALAAVVFWIIGENPDRYSDFKATVVPSAHSGGATFLTEVRW